MLGPPGTRHETGFERILDQKVTGAFPAATSLSFPATEAETVAERLGSSLSTGLTEQEAASRLAACGRNAIDDVRPPRPLRLLAEQLADPLVLLLLAAAFVSGVLLGDALDAAVILAIVVVNAALGHGCTGSRAPLARGGRLLPRQRRCHFTRWARPARSGSPPVPKRPPDR